MMPPATRFLPTLLLAAIFAPPMASAVTLNIDGTGRLTGAQNVDINGMLFDVVFRDGTFGTIFGNPPDPNCNTGGTGACKATASWDVVTYNFSGNMPGSLALSTALMDQVFVDGPQGLFDSNPGLTAGCDNTTTHACIVATPTRLNGFAQTAPGTTIFNGRAINYDDSGVGTDGTDTQNFSTTMNLENFSGAVWADWTPAVVVPLPAAGWLLGSGLAGLGWMRRRKIR